MGAGGAISPMIIGNIIGSCGIKQGYVLTAGSAMATVILGIFEEKIMKNHNYAKSSTTM